MSRIVRGPSAEIRSMSATVKHETNGQVLNPRDFRTMRMEGLSSEEEIAPRLETSRLEGFREAESRAMAQVKAALGNIESLVDEISKFRRELFKECDKDVLELVGVICKKLIQKELSLQPNLLQDMIQKALGTLEKEKRIVLQLNPQDLDTFKNAKPDFLEQFKGIEDITFEVDPRIPAGALMVKSQKMELDINPSAMVDHILAQIKSTKSEISSGNDEGESV